MSPPSLPETPPRTLAPREHGAYGELGLPLVAALGMGVPTLSSALLTVAAATAFTAHEPLLIALGHRGPRARRQDGPRAARLLTWLLVATLAASAPGLVLAPPHARLSAVIPLALTFVVARFIAREDERSLAGEIAAAAALASAALPVALASRVSVAAATEALLVFCLGFGAATWSVRSVIAFAKTEVSLARRVVPLFAPIAAVAALAGAGVLSPMAALAAAPLVLLSVALTARPPHPRSLRKAGFCLLLASLLTTALLIAGARR